MMKIGVIKVSAQGALLRGVGAPVLVPWKTLEAAACQDDPVQLYYLGRASPPQDDITRAVAAAYREARDRAEQLCEWHAPLIGRVIGAHGRWEARLYTEWGGFGVSLWRLRDEGGTHFWRASAEAELRERVARAIAGGRQVRIEA